MSLTGGLDSRMIMAWHKPAPGSLPCYSFGGMFRDCRDVLVGRQVAHACGQSHEVIPVGKEFLSSFPHYARNLNTGKNSLWTSDMAVATQTILHDGRNPSRLVLSVAPGVRAP